MVYFWYDCYCGDDTFKSRYLELFMIAGNKDATVVDYMDVSNGTVYWVLFFVHAVHYLESESVNLFFECIFSTKVYQGCADKEI